MVHKIRSIEENLNEKNTDQFDHSAFCLVFCVMQKY